MTRPTKLSILAAVIMAAYMAIIWWAILPEQVEIQPVKHHGADAITVKWNGEVTAWKWDGKRYRVMWKRGV